LRLLLKKDLLEAPKKRRGRNTELSTTATLTQPRIYSSSGAVLRLLLKKDLLEAQG
jgi:23S rRNA maturation mini-RNase III